MQCHVCFAQNKHYTTKYKCAKCKAVHSKYQELINNVIQTCDEEERKKELAFPVSQTTKQAAECCGKSETLMKKIRKELSLLSNRRDTRPENAKY